ncbi:MAG TPA: acyltransferase [Propionibacteriaceae bacterium]
MAEPDPGSAAADSMRPAGRSEAKAGDSSQRVHSTHRVVQVDNFKSLLVAWIIGCHALLGYTAIGGWPYDEVNEVTMSPRSELLLSIFLGPTGLFVIGTFFFLAGLFASAEMAHRGPAHFAQSRITRLGLPWLAFTLCVWPLLMWLAYRSAGYHLSLWQGFLGRQPFLDSGPLWFAQVLMYVSLGYALWRWRRWGLRFHMRATQGSHLFLAALAIAVASFVVRLWYPARSQQILDLHVWQWPQCVGMFCLGAALSSQGWARKVPSAVARKCGIAVTITLVVAPVLAFSAGVRNFARDGDQFLGGWHWQALALDAVEASLVVAGSVWLLAWAQRRLTSDAPILVASARGAYAAFILQVPVLIGLEIAARPLPLPGFAKGVLVGALAVAGSFWLGSLLARRTKLGKIL